MTPTEIIAQVLRDFPIGERDFLKKFAQLTAGEREYYMRWARAIEVALNSEPSLRPEADQKLA